MTIAVCIFCGAQKFGALTDCEQCHRTPDSLNEVALSMTFTDRRFPLDLLETISRQMAQGHPLPQIPQEFLESMRSSVKHNAHLLSKFFSLKD